MTLLSSQARSPSDVPSKVRQTCHDSSPSPVSGPMIAPARQQSLILNLVFMFCCHGQVVARLQLGGHREQYWVPPSRTFGHNEKPVEKRAGIVTGRLLTCSGSTGQTEVQQEPSLSRNDPGGGRAFPRRSGGRYSDGSAGSNVSCLDGAP